MARPVAAERTAASALPRWIRPQLTRLVDAAPEGLAWLHQIKFDGYRMHACLDRGAVKLLTLTGLDWTHKYPAIARTMVSLGARQAYLDGELCGVGPDGITSFNIVQLASDSGSAAALVFFLFDLLYLDDQDLCPRPLIDRKTQLARLLSNASPSLQYSDHQIGHSRGFHEKACAMHVEGILSKRIDAPYAPRNRGLWRNVKCLNRAEFVVGGWTDPEGNRPYLGAPLLAYYDPDGKLIYAGRVGTGIDAAELKRLWRRLQPLATARMPLGVPPWRSTLFGSALVLSRVHWVRARRGGQVSRLDRGQSASLMWSMRGCARISRRPWSGARCRMRSHEPNRVRLITLRTDRRARRRRQRKPAPVIQTYNEPLRSREMEAQVLWRGGTELRKRIFYRVAFAGAALAECRRSKSSGRQSDLDATRRSVSARAA